MKSTLLLALCACLCTLLQFPATAQSNAKDTLMPISTYYLIRHAEKDRTNPANQNPSLTKQGEIRAQNWANLFNKLQLDAVYSTDYSRTMQTAAPTAKAHDLEILSYDPNTIKIDDLKRDTLGKTVLIVGHSNTTPALVNKLIGEEKYTDMADNDNGSLYIVTILGSQHTVQILTFN